MNDNPDVWKVCALCRHCKKIDEGREIPELVDSEYMTFYCEELEIMTRDDYLMAPVDEEIDSENPRVCPYWEPYPQEDEDLPEEGDAEGEGSV